MSAGSYLHHRAKAALPHPPDLTTCEPGALGADMSRLIDSLEEARSGLADCAERVDGVIEQAEPDGFTPRVPLQNLRAWSRYLGDALGALEAALAEPGTGTTGTGLRSIAGALDELPEIDMADVDAYRDVVATLPGIADLIVWALDAGAHPADLDPGLPASLREAVRLAALQYVPPRAAPSTVGASPTTPETGDQSLPEASVPASAALEPEGAPVPPPVSGAPPTVPLAPSLDRFAQALRPYQQALVDDAVAFALEANSLPANADERQRRRLYAMPTGTGKGTAELELLRRLRAQGRDAWIYTPSLEVLRGYLERCGADPEALASASEDRLAELGEGIYVTTPVRAQNRILTGARTAPDVILYDEVHHATEGNDVSGTLFALAPLAAWIGFTATPFRGSPRGTLELEQAWPDMVEVLSIPEAVQLGAWAPPTFEVVPLVDDDRIKVVNGDFQGKATTAALTSRIADLARLVADRSARCPGDDPYPSERDRPTAVTVPSREVAGLLVEELDRVGVSAYMVSADTPAARRAEAYAACEAGRVVLVSVRVLAEGVDLPWLARLIDARPTLSPVSWLQQIGRITRPKADDVRPEYICVCRNLERHAYLLQGIVPRRVVAQAQEAFPTGPSARGAGRAIGLEALSRFRVIDMPLADGVKGSMHALYSTDPDGNVTEWAVLLDPTSERSITACRTVLVLPDGTRGYGRWSATPLPVDLAGYATSTRRGKVSDKQRTWWERSATRYGLDRDAAKDLTQRQFCALPVLADLRVNLRAEEVIE